MTSADCYICSSKASTSPVRLDSRFSFRVYRPEEATARGLAGIVQRVSFGGRGSRDSFGSFGSLAQGRVTAASVLLLRAASGLQTDAAAWALDLSNPRQSRAQPLRNYLSPRLADDMPPACKVRSFSTAFRHRERNRKKSTSKRAGAGSPDLARSGA